MKPGDHKKLKRITYSKYEQPKSQLILMARERDKEKALLKLPFKVAAALRNAQSASPGTAQASPEAKRASLNSTKITSYQTHSAQRNQLLEELGGFHSKKIENLYLLQRPRPSTQEGGRPGSHNTGHDPHRRLVCKTDVHHYNQQKEEIERLLLENSEYNKEAAVDRQKKLIQHVKQHRLEIKNEHDKQAKLHLASQQ